MEQMVPRVQFPIIKLVMEFIIIMGSFTIIGLH